MSNGKVLIINNKPYITDSAVNMVFDTTSSITRWNTEIRLGTISSLDLTLPTPATDISQRLTVIFTTSTTFSSTITAPDGYSIIGFDTIEWLPYQHYELTFKVLNDSIISAIYYVYGGPLIPIMTSNTTPSGIASTNQYRSGYQGNAYMAFDGQLSTNGDVYYGTTFANNTYTIYTFPSVLSEVKLITLCARIDGSGTITTGTIDYSTDGSTWTTAVNLTSSNFNSDDSGIGIINNYNVNLQNVKAIRAGSTASSNSRGMIVREFQVYG